MGELNDPPQHVQNVMKNNWLGEKFKETCLKTCVWSIIKAKKERVAVENGFLYHYYSLLENVSPILAWGFLGCPKSNKLSILCENLQKHLLGMIRDMFSFSSMDFSQANFDYRLCDLVLSGFIKTCEAVKSASTKREATNVSQGTNSLVPTEILLFHIYELSKRIRGNMDKLLE